MRRTAVLTFLLCLALVGCTGGEILTGLGILAAAWKGKQMLDHPVKGAIAADPGAFWSTIGQVLGLLTLVVTVALKAGNSKGKPKGGK